MTALLAIIIATSGVVPVYASEELSYLPDGYKPAAESENLLLFLNEETGTIIVEDRRNGYLWKSSVDDTIYDLDNSPALWVRYMTSLFIMSYTGFGVSSHTQKRITSQQASITNIDKTPNGVSMDFEFDDLEIKLKVVFELENDTLTVRIPGDSISETEKYGIISIEMMPYFGASNKSVDGYIFYPDGCGALLNYANRDNKPVNISAYKWAVYGSIDSIFDETGDDNDEDEQYEAAFPVYGIKNGGNALLAIGTAGEEDSYINLYPEGNVIDLNRISFEFIYRYDFEIVNSNLAAGGIAGSDAVSGIKFDRNMLRKDHEVKYVFMEGEDANYSGMANRYREYLLNNGKLKKVINENMGIPLALDLLMGIKEKRMLFDKFVPMTTFSQAEIIAEEFRKNGADNLQIMLKGWAKGGYGQYPVNWPPERKLGGKAGIKKLTEYADKNNIDLFLQANFISALSESGGFSKRNDVIKDGNNLIITDKLKSRFILTIDEAARRINNFLGDFAKYPGGIALDRIGKYIFYDYNKRGLLTRLDTQEKWKDILNTVSGNNRLVAAEGANAYVLGYADRLYNVPDKTTRYDITDEEVPFIQMVIHGMMPYTSSPGNLFYDNTKQKLKWVEFGCMPYYELTYESAEAIKNTSYNSLFASAYKNWIEEATSVYKEFNDRLKVVWGERMIEHTRLDKYLYRTRYSNGVTIYINYSDTPRQCDGFSIEAMNYLVVGEGGWTR